MLKNCTQIRSFFALSATIVISSAPQSTWGEPQSFLLQGKGDSGVIEYSLLLAVQDQRAKIAVKGAGCVGSMDAVFSRINRHTWLLTSIGDGEHCEIVLKDDPDGNVTALQGPQCSYYHGAICGFSGQFMAPTKQGLAPIFDPMG